MTHLTLICDAGTQLDRRATADALESRAITGSTLKDVVETATEEVTSQRYERVAIISVTAREPDEERARFETPLGNAGAEYITWVDPATGRGLPADERARLVAGAASAAVQLEPATATKRLDPRDERIVVVEDAALAADVATVTPVTLVTSKTHGRRLPDVRTTNGRAIDILDEDDESSLVVLVDGTDGTERLEADQVVWPGYDGSLADRFDVHTSVQGVVRAVQRVARERARDPVSVDPARCTVGRKGTEGCRACETACPHDAVDISISGDGTVTIDADACTDCGICLGGCPTEAIESSRSPSLETLSEATKTALERVDTKRSRLPFVGSDPDPVVIAFASQSVLPAVVDGAANGPPTVPIPIPDAGRVPAGLFLATLAAGAGGVTIVTDPHEPTEAIENRVDATRDTLEMLTEDAPVGHVSTTDPATVADVLESVSRETTATNDPDPTLARGTTATELSAAAVDVLADGPRKGVTVPSLGSIAVDAQACTLCRACERLCPTGALVQPDASTLTFDPAACTGCGICSACPEDAIEVFDEIEVPLGNRTEVVKATGVVCERCGEEFVSEAAFDNVRDALADSEATATLDLSRCPNCRRRTSVFE